VKVCVLSFIVRRFALQYKNVTGQSRTEIHLVRIVIKIKKALHTLITYLSLFVKFHCSLSEGNAPCKGMCSLLGTLAG
jgi:hypothetical protein